MHRSRVSRSVAVLMTTLFAFQLWLLGSGMFCMMPGPAEQGMTRTTPGAMAMGSAGTLADRPTVSTDAAGTESQMPCDKQMSLPLCQAMGPCITALSAAPVSANAVQLDTPSRVIAMAMLTPPSRTFPPEPPPPRA